MVTFVTDLPFSRRVAYVGLDNRSAGATAAYLVSQWSLIDRGEVLVTLSSSSFRGEEEREIGFRATLRDLAPGRTIHEVTDTDGLDSTMFEAVGRVLEGRPRSTRSTPSAAGTPRRCGRSGQPAGSRRCSWPMTSTATTADCCGPGSCSAVLHHDLRADMRRACRLIMQAQGALPGSPVSIPSQVQLVTPYNEPSNLSLTERAAP